MTFYVISKVLIVIDNFYIPYLQPSFICLTFKTVNPLGANWYGFRESTFRAILSFQPSSSAFCHGVFVFGNRKRILDPGRKHCQLGTGQFWDLVRGDINGDEGRGDRLSTAALWFIVADKYLHEIAKHMLRIILDILDNFYNF